MTTRRRIAVEAFDLPVDRAEAWERIAGGDGLKCGDCDQVIALPEDLHDLEHAERVLGEHFKVCAGRAVE